MNHQRHDADRRLPPQQAFVRHTAAHPPRPAHRNAEQIAGTIVGRHCAGMRGRASGREVLDALHAPGVEDGPTGRTIDWLFGTVETHECVVLMARCGVSIEAMARYARRRRPLRASLCRFLTQFAIDEQGIAWRWARQPTESRTGTES